jgi:hypothetical protein
MQPILWTEQNDQLVHWWVLVDARQEPNSCSSLFIQPIFETVQIIHLIVCTEFKIGRQIGFQTKPIESLEGFIFLFYFKKFQTTSHTIYKRADLFIYLFIFILLNFSFRWFVLFAVFIVLIKGGEKEKKRKEKKS